MFFCLPWTAICCSLSTRRCLEFPVFTPARVVTPPPSPPCLPYLAVLLVEIPQASSVSITWWLRSAVCYQTETKSVFSPSLRCYLAVLLANVGCEGSCSLCYCGAFGGSGWR
ncbi:hypothetical protein PS2_020262 [Malus domestica]